MPTDTTVSSMASEALKAAKGAKMKHIVIHCAG